MRVEDDKIGIYQKMFVSWWEVQALLKAYMSHLIQFWDIKQGIIKKRHLN